MTWQNSEFPGVQYRQHATRKHGVKFDRYFRAKYQVAGKRLTIGFGWASEGWTAKSVFNKAQEYRHNAKTGQGPTTLKEEREQHEQAKAEEQRAQAKQAKLNMTFARFFEELYLPKAQESRPKSWNKDKMFYDHWLQPALGHKLLKEIALLDIEEIKANMYKAGLADRTVQYCLATARQIFNKAIAWNKLKGENPVKGKGLLPRPNNRRARFLTKAEADSLLAKLLEHSQDLHDQALLSLHSGLRAGEILKLTWQNINFNQGLMHVRNTKNNEDRIAYMTEAVREMLEARQARASNALVFPDRKGKQRLEISKVYYKAVNELGLNAGVTDPKDKVCFHTLRHTFASWQVQAGMPLFDLQKLMGHKRFEMVDRYAHLSPENMKKATAIFDQDKKDGKILKMKSA